VLRGRIWLVVSGSKEEMEAAEKLLKAVAADPRFEL